MASFYKHPNGRMVARGGNGRFRKTYLSDLGFEPQDGAAICADCGYGREEEWLPILKTGICPKCSSQEKWESPLEKLPVDLKIRVKEMGQGEILDTMKFLEKLGHLSEMEDNLTDKMRDKITEELRDRGLLSYVILYRDGVLDDLLDSLKFIKEGGQGGYGY